MKKPQQINERSIREGLYMDCANLPEIKYMDFYFTMCLSNVFETLAYNTFKVNNT
jgi:hypothetical protein